MIGKETTRTQKKKKEQIVNYAKAVDVFQAFNRNDTTFTNWFLSNYKDGDYIKLIKDYNSDNIIDIQIKTLLDIFFKNKEKAENNICNTNKLQDFIDGLPYGHWIDNLFFSLEEDKFPTFLNNENNRKGCKNKYPLKYYEKEYNFDVFNHRVLGGHHEPLRIQLKNIINRGGIEGIGNTNHNSLQITFETGKEKLFGDVWNAVIELRKEYKINSRFKKIKSILK